MARIETLHFSFNNPKTQALDFDEIPIFNLSFPVGPKMPNIAGDVMVIQALLSVLASAPHSAILYGLDSAAVPNVTGSFDRQTESSIRSFQNARGSYFLLRADGTVHPGSFKGRTVNLDDPQMTITSLNYEAYDVCFTKTQTFDHTAMIIKMYPQVGAFSLA